MTRSPKRRAPIERVGGKLGREVLVWVAAEILQREVETQVGGLALFLGEKVEPTEPCGDLIEVLLLLIYELLDLGAVGIARVECDVEGDRLLGKGAFGVSVK